MALFNLLLHEDFVFWFYYCLRHLVVNKISVICKHIIGNTAFFKEFTFNNLTVTGAS